MARRATMPTEAGSNLGQDSNGPKPLVKVHDKGETRRMGARETPRERMIRVVMAVQKKRKKR